RLLRRDAHPLRQRGDGVTAEGRPELIPGDGQVRPGADPRRDDVAKPPLVEHRLQALQAPHLRAAHHVEHGFAELRRLVTRKRLASRSDELIEQTHESPPNLSPASTIRRRRQGFGGRFRRGLSYACASTRGSLSSDSPQPWARAAAVSPPSSMAI